MDDLARLPVPPSADVPSGRRGIVGSVSGGGGKAAGQEEIRRAFRPARREAPPWRESPCHSADALGEHHGLRGVMCTRAAGGTWMGPEGAARRTEPLSSSIAGFFGATGEARVRFLEHRAAWSR